MNYFLMALSGVAAIAGLASHNYTTACWAAAYFFSRLEVLALQSKR